MNLFSSIVISETGITMRIYEMNKKIGIKQIDELSHQMPYGKDIYSTGRISFESADEICSVLSDYQFKLQEYGVTNLQLSIVHALTEAYNLEFLVTQIRLKTGLKAKILNHSKEHYLTLQSIARKMPQFNELIENGTLILDIDYGNIQMTLYDHSELISTQSNRLGVSRIRERFNSLEIKKNDYPKMVSEAIKKDLEEYQRTVLKDTKVKNVIVVGGEMTYLNQFETEDDIVLYNREEIQSLSQNLIEDKLNHQVSLEHVYLVTPLMMIVDGFIQMTEASYVFAPNVHLCDGVACDYAYKKLKIFSGHHFTEDRMSTAIHLAKRFECDMTHNLYVRQIAKVLFKAVSKPFGLNNKDQQVLELASILHHCGSFISMPNEEELSYAIVKESEFINLSDINRILVANVLRYKNRPFPQAKDINEPLLSSDFYVILARVIAIFRLAEALDDCHLQKFDEIKASIQEGLFVVRVTSNQDVLLETAKFKESTTLFQEVFGLKPVLKCKRGI